MKDETPCHGAHAGGTGVEVLTYGSLEEGDIVEGIKLRVADGVDELAYALGRVATAAHTADGGHTWVVPSDDVFLVDQREEFALAHHGVGEVEPVELNLSWAVVGGVG